MKTAVIFHRLGPYHFARLRAASRLLPIAAVETSGADETYAWDKVAGSDGFERVTLFENADAQKQPARAVARRMVAALEKIQPQVVVVPGWADAAALGALKWSVEHGVPVVCMSESTEWDTKRRAWSEELKRRIVGLCSAALVGGNPHKNYMVKLGMPSERIFLGYDAVDNEYFAQGAKEVRSQKAECGIGNAEMLPPAQSCGATRKPESGNPPSSIFHLPSSPFFLASARFIEKKNLARLLQAYALYREKAETLKAEVGNENTSSGLRPPSPQSGEGKAESGKRKAESDNPSTLDPRPSTPWSLVLLGDGDLRSSILNLRSSLGLDASVHLPGFRQYPDLPEYYARAGVFIHASTTEQWGLVVNEAMASGLPVLVSNRCGCAADLVQEGVNGFTFDPFNVEQLAQLMFQVSGSMFQVSEFGAASARIIADWGPERFAQGLKAAAECALKTGPKKAGVLERMLLSASMRQ